TDLPVGRLLAGVGDSRCSQTGRDRERVDSPTTQSRCGLAANDELLRKLLMEHRILRRAAEQTGALVIQANGIDRSRKWAGRRGAVHGADCRPSRIFFVANGCEFSGDRSAGFPSRLLADLVADAP